MWRRVFHSSQMHNSYGGVGRNSLLIFALHQPLLRVIRFVGSKIWIDFYPENSLWQALIIDVLILLVLIPLCIAYNRWVQPRLKI